MSLRHFPPALVPAALWLLGGVLPVSLLAARSATAQAAAESSPWLADYLAVWETTREHFVDPRLRGLDWEEVGRRHATAAQAATTEAEAAAAINAMLSELRTSHTRYYTPDDLGYYFLFDLFSGASLGRAIPSRFPGGEVSYVGIGAFTREIDGRHHVTGVVADGPADRAGLLVGDHVLSVAGAPFHPIRSFAEAENRTVGMVVQRTAEPDSRREIIVVPRRIRPVSFLLAGMRAGARVLVRRGGTVGYVRPWSHAGAEVQEAIEELVLDGPLAGADALVLDLRDGWGGASPEYLELFNRGIPVLQTLSRDGRAATHDRRWRKPVALLVNGGTRSGKELLAHGFRRHGYGPVVGTRTAGAVTGGRCFAIGDRGLLYLAVLEVTVDGERLEGVGVEPDVEVSFPVPYAAGHDPQLERAAEAALEGSGPG